MSRWFIAKNLYSEKQTKGLRFFKKSLFRKQEHANVQERKCVVISNIYPEDN